MHGHVSVRVERVCSCVFWGKAESGRSHLQALSFDDSDDVGCTDGAEAMIGGIITDGVDGITPLVANAEEDDDGRLDWAGCGGLGTEVGDGLAADGIPLIVEDEDNMSDPTEMLGGSIPREEEVPNEEHEIHEGTELDHGT